MLQLPLKNLFLSSGLLLCLYSCSPTLNYTLVDTRVVTKADVHPVINSDSSTLYKAGIKLYNKYFSGLIILKQKDAQTSHLAFVTELGMKMFEYEIKNGEFNLVSIFEPLNKPELLEVLKSDFKLILLNDLLNNKADFYNKGKGELSVYRVVEENPQKYFFVDKATSTIQKSIVRGAVLKKKKVDYEYDKNGSLNNIILKHKGFLFLKIELKKIIKENE